MVLKYKVTKITSLDSLKPGDHVRVCHDLYNHHMMVVEVIDDQRLRVIHYTGPDNNPRTSSDSSSAPSPASSFSSGGINSSSSSCVMYSANENSSSACESSSCSGSGGAACASSFSGSATGLAIVREEEITVDLNKSNVELVEYEDPKVVLYEGQEALERARSRTDEKDYSLLFKNCESLINWAITGKEETGQGQVAIAAGAIVGIAVGAAALYIGWKLFTGDDKKSKDDDESSDEKSNNKKK
uniref:LRAT domain-containing protein n=1 Tax=Amphimedon queenslandica TaxID=400682 RepID=A0A1X7SWJ0_AMPQE